MLLLTLHTPYEWGSLVREGDPWAPQNPVGRGGGSGGSSLPPEPRGLDDVRTTSPPEGPRGAWQEGKGSPAHCNLHEGALQPPRTTSISGAAC